MKNIHLLLWALIGACWLLPFSAHAQERKLENLGPSINSSNHDLSPMISADGKIMFFVRDGSSDNVGLQDIWFTTSNEEGSWSSAQNMTALNTAGNDFVSSVTPDGNILILGKHFVNRTRTGWSEPKDIVINDLFNTDKKGRINYFLANDGQVMLISYQGADANGPSLDLYVSFLNDKEEWTKPLNLGGVINTPDMEIAPFLAADGKTLYYASQRPDGNMNKNLMQPTLDIFVSRRQDDSWRRWSAPQNLGASINTTGDELYFVIPACGDWAYMSSGQTGGLGGQDIYRLPIPAGMKPEPVLLVYGSVKDELSGEELTAKIAYKDLTANKSAGRATTNPATGDYTIVLPVGKKYEVTVSVPNYVSETFSVDITGQTECKTEKKTHKLKPLPTIVMGKIFNSATNTPLPATLKITPPGGTPIEGKSTASGEYRVTVPGSYDGCKITINANGYNEINEDVTFTADQKHKEVKRDFGMQASAIKIMGKVLDQETKAPVGKGTMVYGMGADSLKQTGSFPENSAFTLEVPATAGQYRIKAEAYAYYPGSAMVSVSPENQEASAEVLLEHKPPLLIHGFTYNEKTNDPLPDVKIRVQKLADKSEAGGPFMSLSPTGRYKCPLQSVESMLVIAKKDGYISVYEKVELESKELYQEIRRDLKLLPIEIGTTVRLKNIQFDFGKASLLPESYEELDRLVSLMEDASKLVIEIAGHTDNVGGDAANLKLSNDRAASVREYLLSKSVPSDRIQSKGYGKTVPLVKNDTEANRATNRRVEFRVLKVD